MTVAACLKLASLACLALLPQGAPTATDAAGVRRVATLRTARAAHTATALPSGELLVAGGYSDRNENTAGVWRFATR